MSERYFLDVIEEKRSAPLLRSLLRVLSKLYALIIKARHVAYEKRWFSTVSIGVPTVSIGNIVAGGTGKTPLVQLLATALEEEGKIAILTRGFRSQAEKRSQPLYLHRQHLLPANVCGDEPLLLAQTTTASIWVSPNRVLAAEQAKAEGATCLILDDGFQHRRLKRDVEIVAIDANNPFSQHRFLPYGLLRDFPERLSKADLIVANHTRDKEHYKEIKNSLSPYTRAPIVGMQHELLFNQSLQSCRVGAFCGISKPKYFFNALQKAGIEIVRSYELLDHQIFSLNHLRQFVGFCRESGAEQILCTEKDWVKLQKQSEIHAMGLPIHPVRMRLIPIAGKEHWDCAVEMIKQKIKAFR